MKRGTADHPVTDDAKAVGDAIYELRAHKSRRWSQRDLARQMGMANSTVYGWEMGWTKPSHRAIHALCTAFGITRDEFGRRVLRCRRDIEKASQTADRSLEVTE